MKTKASFRSEFSEIMKLPPEQVIEKAQERYRRSQAFATRREYETLAIGAALGALLKENPKEIARLTEARSFGTRGTPAPFRLAMECILGAIDTNGRSRADQWAQAARHMIENLKVQPEKIPTELKKLGGIAGAAKQARAANPRQEGRSPNAALDTANGGRINASSKVTKSGVMTPIKGTDQIEIVVRLSKRAAKAVAELEDHWAAYVTIERMPGQTAFFSPRAKVEPAPRPCLSASERKVLAMGRRERAMATASRSRLNSRKAPARAKRKAR